MLFNSAQVELKSIQVKLSEKIVNITIWVIGSEGLAIKHGNVFYSFLDHNCQVRNVKEQQKNVECCSLQRMAFVDRTLSRVWCVIF